MSNNWSTIDVLVMDHEQYQPYGVAVYRNEEEVRRDLVGQQVEPDLLEQRLADFLKHCRWETIFAAAYPSNGYFPTHKDFEAVRAISIEECDEDDE